ncbi:MAG TPA: ABC transporter ATP-binding protein [Bacteroidales bacterium]|nr:ABC transporter ATP-binding protein [Bacteroidales bacterium]
MIKTEKLKKSFGSTLAVDIDDLSIKDNEILGLAGNNGAGKTTFLRLMLDLIKPDTGKVLSKGIPVYQSDHWKKYTGSYIDQNFLIDFLTPTEYFEFIGFLSGVDKKELKARLKKFDSFSRGELGYPGKYIRELSEGNKQKTGIVGAMISNPEVLILDEPFNSLDPSSQISLKNILSEYRQETNSTIIISSHNLQHISEICTRIVVMEKGKIIMDLPGNEDNIRKIEFYFKAQI